MTAAEVNAGTDLSTYVRNMPDIPRTANFIDVATIDSAFERRQVGTRGGDVLTVEVLRDDASDLVYNTLNDDDAGYLVIGRLGWSTAGSVTTGETIDVYPCTIASIADGTPGRNEADFSVIEMAVTDPPSRNQTV